MNRAREVLAGRMPGVVSELKLLPNEQAFRFPWESNARYGTHLYVYMLVKCGVVIYVGQTGNLRCRIGFHANNKNPEKKDFDSVAMMEVDTDGAAKWWEAVLIDNLRPEWNRSGGEILMPRAVTMAAMGTIYARCDGTVRSVIDNSIDGGKLLLHRLINAAYTSPAAKRMPFS